MKVVITGGAGFIGSHLVKHYATKAEVVVVDDFRSGKRENVEGLPCQILEASILERPALEVALVGADVVFHLAALVSVPESLEKPALTQELNVTGLHNVLEAARRAGVRKLCFASSAAVYGDLPGQPKREDSETAPRSPYAATKLEGEHLCHHFARTGGPTTACLRFFNVFGPGQNPRSAYAAAVPVFFEQALRNEPLSIHGDGGQTRDFIYVKDIAKALAFVAETADCEGVYNAGSGLSTSILDLARAVIAATTSRSEPRFEPTRPGDIRHSRADPSRLLRAGWRPTYTLASALDDLAEWYRQRLQ